MDAVGSEVLAWLGWLLALPGSIAIKAAGMNASEWAAWVQAVGSILAIVAGFGTVFYQNRHTDKMQESDRKSRAEVVALRLSVWLSEIGGRVDISLLRLQKLLNTELPLQPLTKIGFITRVSKRVVLIDGGELANLMIRHRVGVRIKDTYEVKKIDEDYFVE